MGVGSGGGSRPAARRRPGTADGMSAAREEKHERAQRRPDSGQDERVGPEEHTEEEADDPAHDSSHEGGKQQADHHAEKEAAEPACHAPCQTGDEGDSPLVRLSLHDEEGQTARHDSPNEKEEHA